MKSLLYTINKLYDRIPEPTRFITFFLLALPGIIMTGIPNYINGAATFYVIGLGYLLILLAIRYPYIKGWLTPKEKKNALHGSK